MKVWIDKIFAALFGLLALAAAAGAVYCCVVGTAGEPVLLSPAVDTQSQAVSFLDAVCRGDYEAAEELLLGEPKLGVNRPAGDEVGQLVWDSFLDSLSYTLLGDCYATDSGLAQDVKLEFLDIGASTASLRSRSETLLAQLQNTGNASDLYDRDNEYREDVVQQVILTAAQQALEQDSTTATATLTLELTCVDGQWRIVPDEALLKAISGGLAGEEVSHG